MMQAMQSALFSKRSRAAEETCFRVFLTYAQAQLGLGRAYAMGGDKANAKKAYQAFFVTWKDADADLPMLQAAKKEYAAL